MQKQHSLSESEIVSALENQVDKSTVYRSMESMWKAGIFHKVTDTDASCKFFLNQCKDGHQHMEKDHFHFKCERCQHLLCMESAFNLAFNVPAGFTVKGSNLLLMGICNTCKAS